MKGAEIFMSRGMHFYLTKRWPAFAHSSISSNSLCTHSSMTCVLFCWTDVSQLPDHSIGKTILVRPNKLFQQLVDSSKWRIYMVRMVATYFEYGYCTTLLSIDFRTLPILGTFSNASERTFSPDNPLSPMMVSLYRDAYSISSQRCEIFWYTRKHRNVLLIKLVPILLAFSSSQRDI